MPTADIDFIRQALAPAATGSTMLRVEATEEEGRTVALIHVHGAYDCKGTEAEVSGLLKEAKVPWRLVWH